jgi:hypothetical protein
MNSIIFYGLILFCQYINCNNKGSQNNWNHLILFSQRNKDNYFERQTDYLKIIIKSSNISRECEKSVFDTIKALKLLEDWAFQMYNSWGKFPPTGILEGTVTDFGDYDQCLAIQPNQVIAKSQYCLIDISLPLPKPMPIHHNIFHKMNVLPEFVNKSGNNVFVKLSKDASFFYWVYIRLGICSTIKCSQKDVKTLAEKSKFAISLNNILINLNSNN